MDYSQIPADEIDTTKKYSTEDVESICRDIVDCNGMKIFKPSPFEHGKVVYRCCATRKEDGEQCGWDVDAPGGYCLKVHKRNRTFWTKTNNPSKHSDIISRCMSPEDMKVLEELEGVDLEEKAEGVLNYTIAVIARYERLSRMAERDNGIVIMIKEFLGEKLENEEISQEDYDNAIFKINHFNAKNLNDNIRNLKGLIDSSKDFSKTRFLQKENEILWDTLDYIFDAWMADGSEKQKQILNHITSANSNMERRLRDLFQNRPEILMNNDIYLKYKDHNPGVVSTLEKSKSNIEKETGNTRPPLIIKEEDIEKTEE